MSLSDQLVKLKAENSNKKWVIHNGYFGHSYGSPLNPIVVDQDTVNYLAKQSLQSTGENPIKELKNGFMDCIYTKKDSELFKITFGNRIFGLHEISGCIIENELKEVTFSDFQFKV